jgi:glycosyltransferase involved in cell wall biosynthesis
MKITETFQEARSILQLDDPTLSVVIPAYKAEKWIGRVIESLPDFIDNIIVIDDCSPDRTAEVVEQLMHPKVTLLRHTVNKGVGGGMKTGYMEALRLGSDIIIKMDADGQMDPRFLPALIYPIISNECDYTKGNRFGITEWPTTMPFVRRIGNQVLTFINKVASGYWHIFDPQNGFTAINARTLRKIRLDLVDNTYFFENSMLIHLNIIEARVSDVFIPAQYGDEESSLRISWVLRKFPVKLLKGFFTRFFKRYLFRDVSPVAIFFILGSILLLGGSIWGAYAWYISSTLGVPSPLGTLILGLLPIILGFQLLLNALIADIQQSPKGKQKIYEFSEKEISDISTHLLY